MNFEKIPPVERVQDMLDIALKKARQKATQKKLTGQWLEKIQKKEATRLDVMKDNLVPRLEKITTVFPDIQVMSPFYIRLFRLTLDVGELQRSLGSVSWAANQIRTIHKNSVRKIAKAQERDEIKQAAKACIGRISSVLEQISPKLQQLEEMRRIMRTYPDIKNDMLHVCIYGFPNVGKSTLLNTMVGTTAKTASYAFTTKTINSGTLQCEEGKAQILDVPGTLARDKHNLVELQAELVLEDVADIVIYVFDMSEFCGFSVQDQVRLFENIKDKHEVYVYLSKKDILSKEVIDNFTQKHYTLLDLKDIINEKVKTHKELLTQDEKE